MEVLYGDLELSGNRSALSAFQLVNFFCNNNYSKGNFLRLYNNLGGHGRLLDSVSRHRLFLLLFQGEGGPEPSPHPKKCHLTLIKISFTNRDL